MALSDQIVAAESGGNSAVANPRSSALGPGQFINSTWLNLIQRYRPDLVAGRSRDDVLALRSDPAYAQLNRDMTAAYGHDNAQALNAAGLPVTSGSVYLAHFAGSGGAVKVLTADPGAAAADILGPAATKANPWLAGMTAQGLARWADRKVAARAIGPAQQVQPSIGALQSMGPSPSVAVAPFSSATQVTPAASVSVAMPDLPFRLGAAAPYDVDTFRQRSDATDLPFFVKGGQTA